MRIALVQMRCEKAAIATNLDAMCGYLDQAASREIDIVGFPEMSLTGYADPTRYPGAVVRLDGPEVAQLLDITRGQPATVLAGLIEHNPTGKPFITHVAVRDGRLLGHYRKRTIEDEEVDWFSPGDVVPVFAHDDTVFGISICADIGNRDVFQQCHRQGARIVFELAAPGLYGEQATRDWDSGYRWWESECTKYLGPYARESGFWIGVATQAGRTVDEDFPGGGFLFGPRGQRLHATADGSEGAVFLDIDFDAETVTEL